MKLNLKSVVTAVVLVAVVVLASAFSHQTARLDSKSCSLSTLNGAYASHQTGWLGSAPAAQVNRVVSDGAGNVTGSGTRVVGGVVTVIPSFTATYTINADCTGTFATSTGVTQNLVITESGDHVTFIVTSGGGATISGEAIRLDD